MVVQLVLIHYHFRPGGVRRVIEMAIPHIARAVNGTSVLIASGEAPDAVWLRHFRELLTPLPVRVLVCPAFSYVSEQSATPLEIQGKIRAAMQEIFDTAGSRNALVWAHNLGLGRNLLLTSEVVKACESRQTLLIAHHHDWWLDNRWQRWEEMRRSGFRTLDAVAKTVFPTGKRVIHVAINHEDASILQRHFSGRTHWIPNPSEPPSSPTPERIRSASSWLRERLKTDAPVWLIPCRLLRRKNIAEALLLARWLRPEAWLVTTGAVSSADEVAYGQKLERTARREGWPLRLGILADNERDKPSVPELLAASEAVLLTSIQEGFGLPNLEAVAAARPLIARRLSNVAPDLAEFGFKFPQTYDEVLVAPDLFNWEAEAQRQKEIFQIWIRQLPRACQRWATPPTLTASRETPHPVPFSRLTLTAQLEVLCTPPTESWKSCARLNPFLPTWKRRAAEARLKVAKWPPAASKWLAGSTYGARFAEIVGSHAPEGTVSSGKAAQEEFIRSRLDPAHQFPLLWRSNS